jgi:UDP-glucuronate 4-epimerase
LKILLTGAAGFIGFHTARALVARGDAVLGVDNLNDYYDVGLKQARLAQLQAESRFRFEKMDVADQHAVTELFAAEQPQRVVHLAAQAGVRYGITHPHAYADANLSGFLTILEACRHNGVQHLVFASSSSVYGANTTMPFSEHQNVDHPLSLYAATKKANELMAHSYAHLYALPVTGLRFFTVYGPWGRPDMSLFLFARKILADEPIDVFNHGRHRRDFTYIDDIVEGVVRILDKTAEASPSWDSRNPDPAGSSAPYRLYNIGNNRPVELLYVISCLERALGHKARMNFLPLQPGDVPSTCADIDALVQDIGYRPKTRIEDGIASFVAWYRSHHGV